MCVGWVKRRVERRSDLKDKKEKSTEPATNKYFELEQNNSTRMAKLLSSIFDFAAGRCFGGGAAAAAADC